jgi:hypothetical protein
VGVIARVECVLPVLQACKCRESKRGHARISLLDFDRSHPLHQRVAVLARQPDVADQHVGAPRLISFPRRVGGLDGVHVSPLDYQQSPGSLARAGLILDQQNIQPDEVRQAVIPPRLPSRGHLGSQV